AASQPGESEFNLCPPHNSSIGSPAANHPPRPGSPVRASLSRNHAGGAAGPSSGSSARESPPSASRESPAGRPALVPGGGGRLAGWLAGFRWGSPDAEPEAARRSRTRESKYFRNSFSSITPSRSASHAANRWKREVGISSAS